MAAPPSFVEKSEMARALMQQPLLPGMPATLSSALLSGITPGMPPQSPAQQAGVMESAGFRAPHETSMFADILSSALQAGTTEMVGMEPTEDVQRLREKHPVIGMASHLAGALPAFMLPFYGGGALGLKLASKIPAVSRLAKFGTAAESVRDSRMLAAAVRETARFAPLELSRLAVSTVVPGEDTFGRTFGNVMFEMPFIAGAGAAIEGFAGMKHAGFPNARMGTDELKLASRLEGFDLSAPMQAKLAFLQEAKRKWSPEELGDLSDPIKDSINFYLHNLADETAIGGKYVSALTAGAGPTKRINKLFQGGYKDISSRKLVVGEGGFTNAGELTDIQARLPEVFPPEYAEATQFVRLVETKTPQARAKLTEIMADDFNNRSFSNNLFLTQEKDEGLYVGLMRWPGRESVAPAAGVPGPPPLFGMKTVGQDRFLLFKTHDPLRFAPGSDSISRTLDELYVRDRFYVPGTKVPKTQTPTLASAMQMEKMISPSIKGLVGGRTGYAEAGRVSDVSKIGKAIDSILPPVAQAARQESTRLIREGLAGFKPYIAPAAAQFSKSPRAVGILQVIKNMFDRASGITMVEAYGVPDLSQLTQLAETGGVNLITKRLLGRVPRSGGIVDEIKKAFAGADFDARLAYNRAVNRGWTPEQALEAGVPSSFVKLMREQAILDSKKTSELAAQRMATGRDDAFTPMPFHLMMTRTWTGSHRLPIFEAGQKDVIKGYGSGHSSAAATADAQEVIAEVHKKFPGLLKEYAESPKPGQLKPRDYMHIAARDEDLKHAVKVKAGDPISNEVFQARAAVFDRDPRRFAKRRGALGFRGQFEPLTAKEVEGMIVGNLVETNRLLAREAVEDVMQKQLTLLKDEYPLKGGLYDQVINRFNTHQGIQGPISRAIDKAVDKVMAPVLGAQSATRLARIMNRTMFTLTLGAGDLGFVALNAATPIQTALPEVAFLLGAPPARLAEWYSHAVVQGRNTGLHSVSFIEPWRIMRKGFRDLMRAEPEMVADFEWAIKNHVISRPFIESFVGRDAEDIAQLGKVFVGEQGLGNWLLRLSEFGPAKSEEFSRGLAFAMGRRIGKEFFTLDPAQAREMGRQFTYRTMYGYGPGDRARVITGAVGTGFGLFKNWVMNYISNFGLYTNEALFHQNYGPLLWSMIGTGAVGGVAAVPAYGVASAMSRILTDKSLTENIYQLMGNEDFSLAADTFVYGLPAALDVSIHARAAAPGSHFVRDVSLLTGIATLDRAAAIKDYIGDAVDVWATTGRNPMRSQHVRNQFVRAVAPRSLQRWYRISGDGVLRSLRTGNRIQDGFSRFQRGLSTIGLTPVDAEKAFAIKDELYSDQSATQAAIASYGMALAEAWESGDGELGRSVLRAAYWKGVPLDSVQGSAKSRMAKGKEDELERKFQNDVAAEKRRIFGLP